MDGFQEIEETLEREGYLSAGIVSLSSPDNGPVWGISGIPISVRASYYFDVYKTSTTSEIIQAKSENIDTYAIRLRKIIDQVKVKTGSSKVMIIAHSMGGLVSRRYIQLFGNESVEKLILITVPNSGIEGSISISCPIFGAKQECNDMTKGSLFLNNLNYDFSPYVKTYNVIGTGCFSDKKKSDGVVLEKNAYLENANNYYLEGNCSGVEFFHNRILRTNEYPELADLLLEIISN